MARLEPNHWVYSTDHSQLCRIIESETLWGETTCRVWLPGQDTVVRVRAEQLKRLDEAAAETPEAVSYITAAARVADALTQDVLLAPIEASVIPLPHQIRALGRCASPALHQASPSCVLHSLIFPWTSLATGRYGGSRSTGMK